MDVLKKIYRDKDVASIEKKISYLGLDVVEVKSKIYKNMMKDASNYMNVRVISSIIVFLLLLFNTGDFGYIIAPILTVLYYYLFYLFTLEMPIKRRIKRLDHEALNFFEILTLTLESGRNLEHALEVAVDNVDSEISREFRKTLFEVKFGKSLMESLEDMKKRIPSETVNNILLNITQTNVFGNSIIDTMYDQIDFLRDKQILEIKGEINKIPIKISIVSVIFIVPLILILVLGPVVINLF